MSFLAPLFFFGILAVGLPVVFHLIRRTTRERKPFSSLLFLLASPPRLTQRSRLEHLLLLLLRCLAIGLLSFGFARPFIRKAMTAPAASNGRRILILADTSASIRRAGLWSDARRQADSILQKASPLDQVALFTFDRQSKPLLTFSQWNAMPAGERAAFASKELSEVSPGWAATQLGSALIQAAETFADTSGKVTTGPGRIELITDLQEGSHLEQLQGYEWPKGIEVTLNVLKPRTASNASLQLVSDNEDSDASKSAGVRVRVSNAPGSKREQFKVGWRLSDNTGFIGKPIDLYVPAGQSRILPAPIAPGLAADRILLQGDDEDFDNLVYTKPPEAVRLDVLYIGNDEETNPKQGLYFLKRAFQETRHQTVLVTSCRPKELVPASPAQAASFFILTAPLSDESATALRQQVAGGKTLLIIPAAGGMQATLGRLLEVGRLDYQEVRPSSYAMLSEIDFRHPLFAPFADPRFSDFTKIHFWTYSRLDTSGIRGARVLARFDSGDPALVEAPIGTGRVLILASGWQPEASQLALSSKFVPLMYSILESSGAPVPLPAQYRVGDVVPVAPLAGSPQGPALMRLPDGSEQNLGDGQTNFSQTDLPGVYTLTVAGSTRSFVVNLDPAESRTVPLPAEELERLGVPTARSAATVAVEAERKTRFQSAELENRQKLWRWLIGATMMVLLVESWLAGRTTRRALQTVSPASG